MKHFFKIFLAILLFSVSTGSAFAQINSSIGTPTYFTKVGTDSIVTIKSTYELGSTARRINKGYFTDLDVSGVFTLGGVMGSNLDMDGYTIVMDTDGDSALLNDRDGSIADDEIGVQLNSAIDFEFETNLFKVSDGSALTVEDGYIMTQVDDGSNVSPLIVEQNDVTNNKDAVTVANAGTGDSIYIDHNGAGGNAIVIDSESTATDAISILAKYGERIEQDIAAGYGFWVTRNINEAGSNPLVNFAQVHANNTQPLLSLANASTGLDLAKILGVFKIGGTGATNNESLQFDFETVANTVGVSTSTGVTDLSLTAIDINTTTEVNAENLVSTDDADITDNLTAGDIVIDEATGLLNFTGGTSASITASFGTIGFDNENLTTSGTVTAGNYDLATGGGLRTGTTATNTALLQAYDVDGTAYTTFATLTANDTPTMALASGVTGVTQTPADNSTKLATTAYVDTAVGSFAPTNATYITQVAEAGLSAEQALATLATGMLKNTTTTGVLSIATDGTDYLSALSADTTPDLGGSLGAAGYNITGIGALTMGSATADTGVLTMIKGNQTSDPQFTVTMSADGVGGTTFATANGTDGDMTFTASGGDIGFGSSNLSTSGTLGAGAITGTSFIIGGNTLTTSEWGYLDGVNQSLATSNDVGFTDVSVGAQLQLTPTTDEARLDDSAITCSKSLNRIVGSGGAVVLDTDPAIVDGAYDGQVCIIQGTSDVNTVQIVDAKNVQMAGGTNFTLGIGDTLTIVWDSGDSTWYECARADN